MNKNGFTLVELLAVIVILALLVTIAIPSTMGISNKLKTNMFCEKIKSIETAASLYGEDRRDSFTGTYKPNESSTDEYSAEKIKVEKLVNSGYLKKDQNVTPFIIDPRDKESMDDMYLTVYIKYNRVYVHFNDDENGTKTVYNVCNK